MSFLSGLTARYRETEEPLRSERRLELFALALLAVVVLQLLALGTSSFGAATVTPVLPTDDSMRVEQPHESGSISASDSLQLQSRPVFWPSRRPSAAAVVSAPVEDVTNGTPARQLKQLRVTGVFGGGDQGGAIVAYKGKRMRLLIGDEIDGWSLLSVAPGEAVFASAGARDVRRLLPQPVVAAAPAAAEAAAPPPPAASAQSGGSAANAQQPQNQKKPAQRPATAVQQGSLSLGG